MDRRQQKSREAILDAFSKLLSEKKYNRISVQEIIDRANVGRTTFYAHFETKDYLLKELCNELFDHIIGTAMGQSHNRDHRDEEGDQDSVFLHLVQHLQENDRNVLGLLSLDNNEIFMRYFKDELKRLIITQYVEKKLLTDKLPEDYLVNHISSSFVETVVWWLSEGMKDTPRMITTYFLTLIDPLIKTM